MLCINAYGHLIEQKYLTITCGKCLINGPKDIRNTDTTVTPNFIKFFIENEYHAVCTPSVDETVKQYALNK